MNRDTIRDRVLGRAGRKTKIVAGDLEVYVKSPTFGERSRILAESTDVSSTTPKLDMTKLQTFALIYLCVDAENKKVFSPEDAANLLEVAVDDNLDQIINACVRALNVREEDMNSAKKE